MHDYLDLLADILRHGKPRTDRTNTGTLAVFGRQLRFCNISTHFPLVTTKQVHLKSIIHELLWFVQGNTNIAYLQKHGVSIWDAWADAVGELGPIYGKQWRNWNGCDQLNALIEEIKHNPDSRRLLVSSWNVSELPLMKLHPCHVLFQMHVQDGTLSCQLYQRSADVFLGLPFNIASYALLTMMIAQVCGLQAQDLVISLGDAHLYNNHLAQAKEQLTRTPFALPRMELDSSIQKIDDFRFAHFSLYNYQSHPHIKAAVAV